MKKQILILITFLLFLNVFFLPIIYAQALEITTKSSTDVKANQPSSDVNQIKAPENQEKQVGKSLGLSDDSLAKISGSTLNLDPKKPSPELNIDSSNGKLSINNNLIQDLQKDSKITIEKGTGKITSINAISNKEDPKNPEDSKIKLNNLEFSLPTDSKIIKNPSDASTTITISGKDKQIKSVPKKIDLKSKETEIIHYESKDGYTALDDKTSESFAANMGFEKGTKISFKGTLSNDGTSWFVSKGNDLKIKVGDTESFQITSPQKVIDVTSKQQIFFDSSLYDPKTFQGQAIVFGKQTIDFVSTEKGVVTDPFRFIPNPKSSENELIGKDTHFAIAVLGESSAKLDFSSEKTILSTKGSVKVDEDNTGLFFSQEKGKVFYKSDGIGLNAWPEEDFKKSTSLQLELRPFNSNNQPFSAKNYKLNIQSYTGSDFSANMNNLWQGKTMSPEEISAGALLINMHSTDSSGEKVNPPSSKYVEPSHEGLVPVVHPPKTSPTSPPQPSPEDKEKLRQIELTKSWSNTKINNQNINLASILSPQNIQAQGGYVYGMPSSNGQQKQFNPSTTNVLVVKLSADWCGPCKQMGGLLKTDAQNPNGLANQPNVAIVELNIDKSQFAKSLNTAGTIPQTLIFINGKQVDNLYGLKSVKDIQSIISSNLK